MLSTVPRRSLLLLAALATFVHVARPQTSTQYDGLVQSANTQLQAGHVEQALALGRQAIGSDAGRWEAYAVTGGALMNLKRYEEAADSLSKAIDKAPATKQAGLRDLRKQCVLAEAGVVAPTSGGNPSPTPPQMTTQAEVVLWKSIENSQSKDDFDGYLQQYPNGAFVTLARQHIVTLSEEAEKAEEMRLDEAAAVRTQRRDQARRAWLAGVSYSDFGAPSSLISVSPEGFYYKKGNGELRVNCTDVQWKVEPHMHYVITVSNRSTGKKVTLKPVEQQFDIHNFHHLADDLAANLGRYCGAQGGR